jgi:hypothetical protein
MSFQSFCIKLRKKIGERESTYTLVPSLPKGSDAHVKANAKGECTSKHGANKDALTGGSADKVHEM